MTNEERDGWNLLATALNLSPEQPVREKTEEEKMAAYWDHVFALLTYAERTADADALAYADKV